MLVHDVERILLELADQMGVHSTWTRSLNTYNPSLNSLPSFMEPDTRAIFICDHARENMIEDQIPEPLVIQTLHEPDSIQVSYRGRDIYQRRVSPKHILRVIVEERAGIKRVITVYYARADRYEI